MSSLYVVLLCARFRSPRTRTPLSSRYHPTHLRCAARYWHSGSVLTMCMARLSVWHCLYGLSPRCAVTVLTLCMRGHGTNLVSAQPYGKIGTKPAKIGTEPAKIGTEPAYWPIRRRGKSRCSARSTSASSATYRLPTYTLPTPYLHPTST
eukprot:1392254-Rhodomonas_salina.4